MRVAIFTPVLHIGGTEVHTLDLVRALRTAWRKIEVTCYYDSTPSMAGALKDAGAEVTMLNLRRSDGLLALFSSLRETCRVHRPDVVHVQYIAPGLVPVLAARASGIAKIFATVHQPGNRFGWREKLLLRTAARLCTAFFCVSRAVEESWFMDSAVFDEIGSMQGRKHFTIYNGVTIPSDMVTAEDAKAKLGLSGRRVVGIVGRLSDEKGHALLLDALPAVVAAIPETTVLVVGDGPQREPLLRQAKRLGMEDRINWAGQRPSAEVHQLYRAMDVVAVPSAFEGFGLSAAEAMAAGRPVVATRVGGLEEVVADGDTGKLVSPGDPASLARALIGILQDRIQAEDMGSRGKKRVLERFSSDRFAQTMSDAYRYFASGRNDR